MATDRLETPKGAPLFSSGERVGHEPARQGESTFAFLDRVSDPWWDRLRQVIEEMVTSYPYEAQPRLIERLRGSEWDSAFWELYLHRVCTQQGWRVTVEPRVPGTSYRPDFLVEASTSRFYIEATVAGPSEQERGEEQRLSRLLSGLESLADLNLSWLFVVESVGPRDLAALPIERAVRAAVAGRTGPLQMDPLPRISRDGWSIEVHVSTLPEALRGRGLISSVATGATRSMDDLLRPLKNALKRKVERTRELDGPAIIAVDLQGRLLHHDKWLEDLLLETGETALDGTGSPTWDGRRANGRWQGRKASDNANVAGVLLAYGLGESTMTESALHLKLNPTAETLGVAWPWTVHTFSEGHRTETRSALNAADLLGLDLSLLEEAAPFARINRAPAGPGVRGWIAPTVDQVVQLFDPQRIILFGSAARDEDTQDSDLDLLVVMREPHVTDPVGTMRGLRRATRGIPVPKDFIVVGARQYEEQLNEIGTMVNESVHGGRVVYERAA